MAKKPPNEPPVLKKAVTIGQISGLKLNEKDGSWNITVNVQREHVPSNIEQWAFQNVVVAVLESKEDAKRVIADGWGGFTE